MMGTNLARCDSLQDIQKFQGERVVVVGTYTQVDIRMRKKGSPLYVGYVAILLQDGTKVFLEPTWSLNARRSQTERADFENKQVEVVGIIHLRPPEPPEPVAYVIEPCISPVEDISFIP